MSAGNSEERVTDCSYTQVERTFTPDGWRATTYRRTDGSEFHVALPPIHVMADYGNGRVFLDHDTYNEAAEHRMALSLAMNSGRTGATPRPSASRSQNCALCGAFLPTGELVRCGKCGAEVERA